MKFSVTIFSSIETSKVGLGGVRGILLTKNDGAACWTDKAKILKIEPSGVNSVKEEAERTYRIELLPEGTIKSINYSGRPIEVKF